MKTKEQRRIEFIQARLKSHGRELQLGIGDDAAVLAPLNRSQVLSVDTNIENIHFRRHYLSAAALGYRAVVTALSDLAAMSTKPRAMLVALGLPMDVDDVFFEQIIEGVAEAAQEYVAPVIGGNLSSAAEISITTTVIGEVDRVALGRQGAHLGESIFVTGVLGAAAMGLLLLEKHAPGYAGLSPNLHRKARLFVEHWRRPKAHIADGLALQEVATAGLDVSDGLLQDLAHLCEASGVGAEIMAERLPLLEGHLELAEQLGVDALSMALTGGEDYELLFTAKKDQRFAFATCIGNVVEQKMGVKVRNEAGKILEFSKLGFRHF